MEPARAADLLARERERIESALDEFERERREEIERDDQHGEDRSAAMAMDERDEAIADRLHAELEALERAERRLAEGTYGLSIESGEPIPEERLEARPTAERTVEEQARYDRGG
ncbi:MAG: TraR/DksA family transcriptional regulator [Gaiellales bacterium]